MAICEAAAGTSGWQSDMNSSNIDTVTHIPNQGSEQNCGLLRTPPKWHCLCHFMVRQPLEAGLTLIDFGVLAPPRPWLELPCLLPDGWRLMWTVNGEVHVAT